MDSITHQLYEAARAGDAPAYDRLFAIHADRVLMFIRARLGPRLREKVDGEDVLQETYLAAHRDFASFTWTGEEAFLRWLCRIAGNRLADLGDRFGARKRQPVAVPRSGPTGPVTAMDRAENREKLLRALDLLAEDQRQVVLFRWFEGLSAEETGERMGRSAGAVRKLAARALAELGRTL